MSKTFPQIDNFDNFDNLTNLDNFAKKSLIINNTEEIKDESSKKLERINKK